MKVNEPRFIISAYKDEDFPAHNLSEIAFSGRSNVGKSSMINCLLNRNKLARISSQPGRTQSINFYDIDGEKNIARLIKKFEFGDLDSKTFINAMVNIDFDNDGIDDLVAVNENKEFYIITGSRDLSFGVSKGIAMPDGYTRDITLANFDGIGGDDFVIFTSELTMVYLNSCTSGEVKVCNTCQTGNKSLGDANCDGKIDLVDFEIWRSEYFDGENEDDWKADFDCTNDKGLQKPGLSDFNTWRISYFDV